MTTVTIRDDIGMTGYLAVPDGEGPWPGVIVVHDALGPTADLRRQADWIARAGFVALAPDLYSRSDRRLGCVVAAMRALQSGSGDAFDDLDAARRHLADRPDCTGRIGVIGFCMGGGFALALAGTGDYAAANPNYGDLFKPARAALPNACPVLATFGARDRSLKKAPAKLEAALRDARVEHEIVVYPDAGHGFLNDHDDADIPWWVRLTSSLMVNGPHEESATDARRRIEAFLHAHLDG